MHSGYKFLSMILILSVRFIKIADSRAYLGDISDPKSESSVTKKSVVLDGKIQDTGVRDTGTGFADGHNSEPRCPKMLDDSGVTVLVGDEPRRQGALPWTRLLKHRKEQREYLHAR